MRSLMVSGMRSYPSMMAGDLAPFSVLPFSSRLFAKFERNKPHMNVGTIGKLWDDTLRVKSDHMLTFFCQTLQVTSITARPP